MRCCRRRPAPHLIARGRADVSALFDESDPADEPPAGPSRRSFSAELKIVAISAPMLVQYATAAIIVAAVGTGDEEIFGGGRRGATVLGATLVHALLAVRAHAGSPAIAP